MDEDGMSSGLGDLALFEMGRQSERGRQVQDRLVSGFAARMRGQVQVDVNALLATNQALHAQNQELWRQNQALRQQNQALQQDVQRYYQNACEYEIWANKVVPQLKALRAEKQARDAQERDSF